MARGKKTPEEKREQAKAIVYLNPSIPERELAKELGVSNSHAHDLKKEAMQTDEYEQARATKKAEFIENAWNVVQKALKLTEKRFDKALDDEDAIQKLIDDMNADADLKAAEKQSLYRRLKDLQMTNIKDIAIALGTIYDKQALASGEPTQISERSEPVTKLLEEYEEKVKKLKSIIGEKTG